MSTKLFTYRSKREDWQMFKLRPVWSCGLLFNIHAWWLGVHYSRVNHRWCINLLPCLTFWVRGFGGHEP